MTLPNVLEIILLKKKKKKFKKILNFQGVTYFFTGGIVKKYEFGYVGTILVTELNIYVYNNLLVLGRLILSVYYVAYFSGQLLSFTDQIVVNCRPKNN